MDRRIYAIIPARGGSTRVPGKNSSLFAGAPLLSWTIRQTKAAKRIKEVYVSTDSDEIAAIARAEGAQVIMRPAEIAHAHANVTDALKHAVEEITKLQNASPELLVFLNPTHPLREPSDIDAAIEAFEEQGVESLFSGSDIGDFYVWRYNDTHELESVNYDYKRRQRSQEFPPQYVENGSLYIFTPELLERENNFLGGRIGISLMERWKSIEINTMDEFRLLEELFIMHKLHE